MAAILIEAKLRESARQWGFRSKKENKEKKKYKEKVREIEKARRELNACEIFVSDKLA